MAKITAADVSKLRTMTGVSMMECKKALVNADGDIEAAVKSLREHGVAVAAKRAEKEANQGLIATKTSDDASKVVIVEVNCETDFVARNEDFKKFADDVAQAALDSDVEVSELMKDEITSLISAIGEKIEIRRATKFNLEGIGIFSSYIHLGGKVGVIVEVGCEKAESIGKAELEDFAKDITLQIAAMSPRWLNSSAVPADTINTEREIYANQMKDEKKPENIMERIIEGRINKFYEENCLVNQVFVKDSALTISKLQEQVEKQLDDKLVIRRFERFQLGA
ncbi:MAG: elongation factor Ts [Lentisphaerae bacterium]|jgi:elongation factor Ts|nr:elongation factor Ts [Lentisphaerota bacterium]